MAASPSGSSLQPMPPLLMAVVEASHPFAATRSEQIMVQSQQRRIEPSLARGSGRLRSRFGAPSRSWLTRISPASHRSTSSLAQTSRQTCPTDSTGNCHPPSICVDGEANHVHLSVPGTRGEWSGLRLGELTWRACRLGGEHLIRLASRPAVNDDRGRLPIPGS